MDFFFISFPRSGRILITAECSAGANFTETSRHHPPWNIIFNGGGEDLINFPYPPFPLIFFLRGNYTKLWISIAIRDSYALLPPFLSFIPPLPFPHPIWQQSRGISGLFKKFLHAPTLEFLAATIHGRVWRFSKEKRKREKARGGRGRERRGRRL